MTDFQYIPMCFGIVATFCMMSKKKPVFITGWVLCVFAAVSWIILGMYVHLYSLVIAQTVYFFCYLIGAIKIYFYH